MESLKKIINLSEAAKMSGYTQDYLGYLIRTGEMKGKKLGRNWVTTQEELNNYIFKRKIRQNELALNYFVSKRRIKSIITISIILLIIVTSIVMVSQSEKTPVTLQTELSNTVEATTTN